MLKDVRRERWLAWTERIQYGLHRSNLDVWGTVSQSITLVEVRLVYPVQ